MATKEPWEMTRDEFFAEGKNKAELYKKGLSPAPYFGEYTTPIHKNAIKQALSEGRPVPTEVLRDYPELGKKEVQKVRYHILPDGVIWAKERGDAERILATWCPANRPDATNTADEGTIYGDSKVYTNKADWDKAVRQKLNLDTSEYIAEAWRGGGMIHKGDLIKEQAETKVWRRALLGKAKPSAKAVPKPKRKSKPRKHSSSSAGVKGLRR